MNIKNHIKKNTAIASSMMILLMLILFNAIQQASTGWLEVHRISYTVLTILICYCYLFSIEDMQPHITPDRVQARGFFNGLESLRQAEYLVTV